MKDFEGYGVEMGANWIHGLYNEGYDPNETDAEQLLFTNPVWKFKNENPRILNGTFTDYEDAVMIDEEGNIIDEQRVDQAWDNVEGAIETCQEYSGELWDEYCKQGLGLEEVEKKDLSMRDCVSKRLPHDATMDTITEAVRDAFLWEAIEFETGIFNNSIMHSFPLNAEDRISYNDQDWFIKNGYDNERSVCIFVYERQLT